MFSVSPLSREKQDGPKMARLRKQMEEGSAVNGGTGGSGVATPNNRSSVKKEEPSAHDYPQPTPQHHSREQYEPPRQQPPPPPRRQPPPAPSSAALVPRRGKEEPEDWREEVLARDSSKKEPEYVSHERVSQKGSLPLLNELLRAPNTLSITPYSTEMESQNKENKESSSNVSKNRKNENRIPPMKGRQNVKKEGQPKKKRTRNVKTEQAEKEDPAKEAKIMKMLMQAKSSINQEECKTIITEAWDYSDEDDDKATVEETERKQRALAERQTKIREQVIRQMKEATNPPGSPPPFVKDDE